MYKSSTEMLSHLCISPLLSPTHPLPLALQLHLFFVADYPTLLSDVLVKMDKEYMDFSQ